LCRGQDREYKQEAKDKDDCFTHLSVPPLPRPDMLVGLDYAGSITLRSPLTRLGFERAASPTLTIGYYIHNMACSPIIRLIRRGWSYGNSFCETPTAGKRVHEQSENTVGRSALLPIAPASAAVESRTNSNNSGRSCAKRCKTVRRLRAAMLHRMESNQVYGKTYRSIDNRVSEWCI